jgi:hypothetical protein
VEASLVFDGLWTLMDEADDASTPQEILCPRLRTPPYTKYGLNLHVEIEYRRLTHHIVQHGQALVLRAQVLDDSGTSDPA